MSKATLSALAILMATGLTVAVDAQARERGVQCAIGRPSRAVMPQEMRSDRLRARITDDV